MIIDRINELQKLGLSNRIIERGSGLSNGYLTTILKQKKPLRPTTEKKINAYYSKIIKNLIEKL